MTTTDVPVAPAPEEAPPLSEPARMFGVIWSPRKAFTDIVRRPSFWAPFVLLVVFQTAVSLAIYKPVIIPSQLAKMAEQPNFTAEKQAMIEKGMESPVGWVIATATGLLGMPIALLLWAGMLYFVFSLLMSGRANFKSVFTVVCYASIVGMIAALVKLPLMIARQDLEVSIGPAALLERPDPPTFLYSFLQGMDVLGIWSWLVVAVGLSVLYRKPQGSTTLATMAIFLVFVLVSAGIRSMFHPGS